MLSGPIAVEAAEPGDLLIVDILDLGPVPQAQADRPGEGWEYSGPRAKVNRGGFVTDYYPDARSPRLRTASHPSRCHHGPRARCPARRPARRPRRSRGTAPG